MGVLNVKKILFIAFAVFIPIFALGLPLNLTVSPVFLLKNESVTLTMTSSPTIAASSAMILLYDFSSNSTSTLYNPSIFDGKYTWNYNVTDAANYRAVGILSTSSSTYISNTTTFTSNIPAASVQSTILYVPFISNNVPSYNAMVENIGSQTLSFTASSSPSGLSISPQSASIRAGNTMPVNVSATGFFLPGRVYVLDASMETNDPRPGQSNYLLARFILGPDGLVITHANISGTNVGIGSSVSSNFSIYHSSDVSISYVYVTWITPTNSDTFSLSAAGNDFSSSINITSAGTYVFSKIIVGYTYKDQNLQMVIYPNIKISAVNMTPSMNIRLINGTRNVVANIDSVSTPTVKVIDDAIYKDIPAVKFGQTWVATYTYLDDAGNVTITSTFANTTSVISKSFTRYMVSEGTTIYLSDGGWVTIPSNAFVSPSLVAVYLEPFTPQTSYIGYSNFNQVSDAVSMVSSITPSASFNYNLYFSNQSVNGLIGNVKVYSNQNENWQLSAIKPNVEMQMANFYAKTGTYALGLDAQIQTNQSPSIISFYANPSNLIGPGNVQFFLTVNSDCYYQLYIYDMRGKIISVQSGTAIKTLGNLIYTLNTSSISNGLYVAALGIGNLPGVFAQTRSISFAISK